eukprot:13723567-Alexandrium_andersonii.AAC.1
MPRRRGLHAGGRGAAPMHHSAAPFPLAFGGPGWCLRQPTTGERALEGRLSCLALRIPPLAPRRHRRREVAVRARRPLGPTQLT